MPLPLQMQWSKEGLVPSSMDLPKPYDNNGWSYTSMNKQSYDLHVSSTTVITLQLCLPIWCDMPGYKSWLEATQ